MQKPVSAVLAAAMAFSVAACSSDGTGPGTNQTLGTIAGAVAGGVIGNQVGGGRGKTVATAVGIVAGGLIGSKIGQSLDEADRRRAMDAEYRALEYSKSGSPVVWRNPDRNVYGEVVPGQTYQNAGRNCREYTHTIYIDGQPQVAKGTACRSNDGTWQPVS